MTPEMENRYLRTWETLMPEVMKWEALCDRWLVAPEILFLILLPAMAITVRWEWLGGFLALLATMLLAFAAGFYMMLQRLRAVGKVRREGIFGIVKVECTGRAQFADLETQGFTTIEPLQHHLFCLRTRDGAVAMPRPMFIGTFARGLSELILHCPAAFEAYSSPELEQCPGRMFAVRVDFLRNPAFTPLQLANSLPEGVESYDWTAAFQSEYEVLAMHHGSSDGYTFVDLQARDPDAPYWPGRIYVTSY